MKALVFLVVAVAVLPLAAYHFPAAVGKDGGYLVLSGSMEPEISAGDIIFTERVPASGLKTGDVITYTSREDPDTRFTHRIVEIQAGEKGPLFVTKGDANDRPDPGTVSPDRIEGRYAMLLPYYGHVLAFAQTDLGFLMMIIGPGLLIIALQIRTVYQVLVEIEQKAKEKKARKAEVEASKQKPAGNESQASTPLWDVPPGKPTRRAPTPARALHRPPHQRPPGSTSNGRTLG